MFSLFLYYPVYHIREFRVVRPKDPNNNKIIINCKVFGPAHAISHATRSDIRATVLAPLQCIRQVPYPCVIALYIGHIIDPIYSDARICSNFPMQCSRNIFDSLLSEYCYNIARMYLYLLYYI